MPKNLFMAKLKSDNNKKDLNENEVPIQNEELGKIKTELEGVKSMLARALADYDNLFKRTERERQDLGKLAAVSVIIKLLPVLDSLEMAQEHLKDAGLAISIGEFKKILSEEGLTEIKPLIGDEFNEEVMEAVDIENGEENNKIVNVSLVGWKFSDGTVVRHAKVVVSKKEI